jgi:hypothetical protein
MFVKDFRLSSLRTHATVERNVFCFGLAEEEAVRVRKSAFHSTPRRPRDGDYSKGLNRDNGGAGVRWTHFLQGPRKYYFKLLCSALSRACYENAKWSLNANIFSSLHPRVLDHFGSCVRLSTLAEKHVHPPSAPRHKLLNLLPRPSAQDESRVSSGIYGAESLITLLGLCNSFLPA